MKIKTKLSKKAESLIEDFAEDSKYWGYQSDQGTDDRVIRQTEIDYYESKEKLESYVLKLETTIKLLKKEK